MYLKERIIICAAWLFCLISLRLIPKNKYREASFIFLLAQLPAWILGLCVVEADMISYPVRLFWKANYTNFCFEYLVLPFMCIFFNLYYPNTQSTLKKVLYYLCILSGFTLMEALAEKHTKILTYIGWRWYYTFLSMLLVIYIVRVVYKWFFHIRNPFSL